MSIDFTPKKPIALSGKQRLRRRKWRSRLVMLILLFAIAFLTFQVTTLIYDNPIEAHKAILLEEGYNYKEVEWILNGVYYVNEKYLEGIERIKLKEHIEAGRKSGGYAGLHNCLLGEIIISQPYAEHFVHEIGHEVWCRHLNIKQKREWKNISKNSHLFVTSYAKKNYQEDFSETFQVFSIDRKEIEYCDNTAYYSFYDQSDFGEITKEEWEWYIKHERCDDIYSELSLDPQKVEFMKENILEVA